MAGKADDRLRGYVVISSTLEGEDYRDCQVIPHGDPFLATHRQVFGPASEKDCKQWAAQNCKKSSK
ncbi:MAG TPA: hypothetical protein VEK57_28030 [Thermoanaerobaculia bacterium]|nr:hypothetical protein [Thermoanaerobaculia bacterium]